MEGGGQFVLREQYGQGAYSSARGYNLGLVFHSALTTDHSGLPILKQYAGNKDKNSRHMD